MTMDNGSVGSGSGGGGGKYHRHTPQQIQRLDSVFMDCPHPDEKTRLQLSRELNLAPRQIKFWFQNRRTQMKVQHERLESSTLREENDKIRCENIAMREALKNVICNACGGPPVWEDNLVNVQKLQMENAQLQEELERVSSIAAKYLGVPISQLPQVLQSVPMSSPGLSMDTNYNTHGSSSSTSIINPVSGGGMLNISETDKSLMADVARNSMDELIMLLQYPNEPLWVKSSIDGREVLNLDLYDMMFPRPSSNSARLKNPNTRIESSRESAVVIMNSLTLVDMFMDVNKWVELFPNIVSKARTLEVISSGNMGSHNGTLQMMYEELQVLSPFVPPRQFYLLRFCHQIEPTCWAIVDVSLENFLENQSASASSPSCKTYKFPSGCLIQELGNEYSRVTWVEHVDIEENVGVHGLFRDLFQSGMTFGAGRWLTTLERVSQRHNCFIRGIGGVVPSPEGKRSMMKLGQRMVISFCASINPSNGQQWTTLSRLNEYDVRAMLCRCTDPGQPNGVVVSAATTFWLPIPPQLVFDFLRDEKTRHQWDVLCNKNPMQEVAFYSTGSHPGNCISVLRPIHAVPDNIVILQESCVDSSGSMVVFCPVDLHSVKLAMKGEDPPNVYLLPSGFAISPDGSNPKTMSAEGASSSAGSSSGSLVTVVLQIRLPSATMTPETEITLTQLIGSTVHQIKDGFNCTTTTSS